MGKQKKQRRKTTSTGTSMASIKSELRKAMRREAAKEEMRVLSALGVDVIKLEEYICQARKRCDEDRETQRQSPPKENKGEVPDADLGWYESTKKEGLAQANVRRQEKKRRKRIRTRTGQLKRRRQRRQRRKSEKNDLN